MADRIIEKVAEEFLEQQPAAVHPHRLELEAEVDAARDGRRQPGFGNLVDQGLEGDFFIGEGSGRLGPGQCQQLVHEVGQAACGTHDPFET